MKPIDPLERFWAVVKQEGNQKRAAAKLGISPVYFGDMLHGRRDISDRMLAKVGLKRIVVPADKA